MKKIILAFLLIPMLSMVSPNQTKACNRSSYVLDSLIFNWATSTYTVYSTLCIGFGKTGLELGADGPTGTFFLAVFSVQGQAAITAALTSVTASFAGNIVGAETCPPTVPTMRTATATVLLAGEPLFAGTVGEEDDIRYRLPPIGGSITCVTSATCCGDAASACHQIIMTYVGIRPDSIRTLGIEGAAPLGGCWPDADMVINLGILPVVWNDFSGVSQNGGVNLNWSTYEEHRAKEYKIMRSSNGSDVFTEIGKLDAKGNNIGILNYNFFDSNPEEGVNLYQLWQVDADGMVSKSEIISLNYSAPIWISLRNVYPNPSSDLVTLDILSGVEAPGTISVWTVSGQKLIENTSELLIGSNSRKLDVSNLAPGTYFLRLSTLEGVQEKRIVVQ